MLSAEFADLLTQHKIPFLVTLYPSEETEALAFRNGEIGAQVALVDLLSSEVMDETIQTLDEGTRLLAAASKEISMLRRRN